MPKWQKSALYVGQCWTKDKADKKAAAVREYGIDPRMGK
jgi:hypothetical protein